MASPGKFATADKKAGAYNTNVKATGIEPYRSKARMRVSAIETPGLSRTAALDWLFLSTFLCVQKKRATGGGQKPAQRQPAGQKRKRKQPEHCRARPGGNRQKETSGNEVVQNGYKIL